MKWLIAVGAAGLMAGCAAADQQAPEACRAARLALDAAERIDVSENAAKAVAIAKGVVTIACAAAGQP